MSGNRGLQKYTRTDAVRYQLEREILAGLLRPGGRLDEIGQAERLGCSRTPLREAFNQLIALGLLVRKPHCGVFVADDTSQQACELIEAFAEVEALCAALAVERMAPRLRAGLLRKAERDPALLRRAVRQACDNRILAEQAEALERRVAGYRRFEGGLTADLDRMAAKRVAEAVLAGRPDLARSAVHDRLRVLRDAAAGGLGHRERAAA